MNENKCPTCVYNTGTCPTCIHDNEVTRFAVAAHALEWLHAWAEGHLDNGGAGESVGMWPPLEPAAARKLWEITSAGLGE